MMDGWMLQTLALDPALLMYVYMVRICVHARTHTCYLNVLIDVLRHLLSVWSAKSDEETSDGLDGQDASRLPSVDGEAVPGGEQDPTQGRPCRSHLTNPLCERETSLRPSSSTR